MKRVVIFSWMAVGLSLLAACKAQVQTYVLADEYATTLHYEGTDGAKEVKEEVGAKADLAGMPAMNFYGGDLKRGGIWYAGSGMFLEKGEVFTFSCENVGPDTIPFGATFSPLDFTKEELTLKITAKVTYSDSNSAAPTLYVQLGDADGYQANANRPFSKIERDSTFKEYYFNLKDVFMQATPKKHKVNGAMINTIKVFINPGSTGFNGELMIKEIKIIPAKKG